MLELLAVGLSLPPARVPSGARVHHVAPGEVGAFLDRYGSVLDGALVGDGRTDVEAVLRERVPTLPVCVMARGALEGRPANVDRAVASMLARLAGTARQRVGLGVRIVEDRRQRGGATDGRGAGGVVSPAARGHRDGRAGRGGRAGDGVRRAACGARRRVRGVLGAS